jgi:hypothetical protein
MIRKWVLVLATVLLILSPLYFWSFDVDAVPASAQITTYSIADAYVNASSPETNYGSAASLYVSANSEQDFTYIKFDLTSIPSGANIISANLTVYLSDTGGDIYWLPADSIGAYYCSDNSWIEPGITWNNKPSFNVIPTDSWSFGIIYYENEYKSWDVTADVNTALTSETLTEVMKFASKTGDGYAVFQSGEGANRPKLEVEYSAAPALSNFYVQFAANNVRVIYPSDNPTKPLGCVAAWVSDWTASAFITTKLQNYTEGLDTDSNFVDQTSGRPQGVSGLGIVSFGGPIVNPVVKCAESSGTSFADRAPIRFYSDGSVFYFQHWNGSSIPGASLPVSVINHDQDMFVMEVYIDGSGRYMMLCYGFGWKGTYAAGKYFHTTIYPNLASYSISWIVVKWQDTNGDSFVNNPSDGDTYTIIASST